MALSARNLFALFLFCLLSSSLWAQTGPAFFEYPVDSACNADPNPVFVSNQTTPGGSFSSIPAGLALDPISGAISANTSAAGIYQVTHTVNSPTPFTYNLLFTIVGRPVSQLNYPINTVCKGLTSLLPVDTIGLPFVGTYAATPNGLVIDPNNGTINVDASQPGNYTVSHIVGVNPCADTALRQISIIDPAPFSLDYGQDSVCPNGVICPITPTGPTPGLFQPRVGLAYSNSQGCVDLVSTLPGSYTVCFVETAQCRRIFCDTVVVLPPDDPFFSYPTVILCENADSIVPTTAGTPGFFSYTSSQPSSVLQLNSSTGAVTPSGSSPGTYTVTLNSQGSCPDTISNSLIILPVPTLPAPIINYGDTLLELNTSFFTTWYCDSTVVATNTNSIPVTMAGQYYAIAMDAQGCTVTSDTVNIGATSLQDGDFLKHLVRVSPNPSNGIYHIQTERLSRGKLQLEVFDLHGRKVYAEDINPGHDGEIDLSNQSAGIYLLRLTYQNQSTTLKLIKTANP